MRPRTCRLFHIDTFTRERFCGNPAVVVLDADELEPAQMQRIASELGREVGFVAASDSPDFDVALRFFAPRREIPFVGHVTVAAHYVRALVDGVPQGRVRQRSGGGLVEVEVQGEAPALRVTTHQGAAAFGPVIPDERCGPLFDALGLSSASVHPSCPPQVMTKATSRLLIGLRSPEALESLQPKMDELVRLTPHIGADGFLLFALRPNGGSVVTEARLFAPAVGIPEDPASGNAHGMLGCYLVHCGLLLPENGTAGFRGHQGRFVGRPSEIEVEVDANGRHATGVRVTGDAVVVYEARLPI